MDCDCQKLGGANDHCAMGNDAAVEDYGVDGGGDCDDDGGGGGGDGFEHYVSE